MTEAGGERSRAAGAAGGDTTDAGARVTEGTGQQSAQGAARLTLFAMTLANSMILVDQTAVPLAAPRVLSGLGVSQDLAQWLLTANVLPLAAFMVLGGRLGDMLGLRRVFLAGATVFVAASALAGLAQSFPWLIAARAVQGTGAALMMPASIAIVSAVFPREQRGRALGTMAGASAFFAATGPVIGGLLTQFVDWRAVFFINVPLALVTILLTLRATPRLAPAAGSTSSIDYPGVVAFAIGIGALVFGIGQGPEWGWSDARTVAALAVGVAGVCAFVTIELRRRQPLMRLGLLRHLNFAAANVSQLIAGMVELGLGLVMPLYLLLGIGQTPALAGIALIPATVPIMIVAPLAGRVFDRRGGRLPLVAGFVILAASSVWLALVVDGGRYAALVPALVLQGIGLGTILTVNDPTGINSVPERDRGQAAGVINTAEQLGGALGIALLSAVLFGLYHVRILDVLARAGLDSTSERAVRLHDFIHGSEATGLHPQDLPPGVGHGLLVDAFHAFAGAFEITLFVAAGLALVGAIVTGLLVRRSDRVATRIFGRRSRWAYANVGQGPALTRKPIE